MKKLYTATILSLTSLSLSGMEIEENADYTITAIVKPLGKSYSKESDTEKKFIRVKATQFTNTKKDTIVFSNNNIRLHSALETYVPKEAPVGIFTEDTSYTARRTDNKSQPNIIYAFTLKAHKQYSEESLSDNS